MGIKIQFKKGITSTDPSITAGSFIETDYIIAVIPDNKTDYWNGGATLKYLNGTEIKLGQEEFAIFNKITTSNGLIPDTRQK